MPYLEIQLTRKLQRVYDVAQGTTIGRAPQCDIQLLSRAVSRRHAKTEVGERGEVIISDVGTKNGIKLNGQRIVGAAIVSEGDQIVVGDVSMIFRAGDRGIVHEDVIDLRQRPASAADLEVARAGKATFRLPAEATHTAAFQASLARERIQALEFDEEARFKLQIALKEAMDNAIEHGCGGDPSRSVLVTFNEDADEFIISVRDEGPGYDVEAVFANVQEVDALDAIRRRAELGKGLGLRIVLNCVDRLQFEKKGSTIHMGRLKHAGQIFVISDDSGGGETEEHREEEPAELDPFAGFDLPSDVPPMPTDLQEIDPFDGVEAPAPAHADDETDELSFAPPGGSQGGSSEIAGLADLDDSDENLSLDSDETGPLSMDDLF